MTQAVLLAGLFIGVLSALPIIGLANCCCLWIIGGGMLSAYLTQQNESAAPITPGRGALAGLLAGGGGAVVWLVVAVLLDAVLAPLQQRMVEEALRNAQDMPPGAREWMEMFAGRGSAALRHALGFGLHMFGALFAALGGLMGAVLFRTNTPPTPGDLVSPPPLPPQ